MGSITNIGRQSKASCSLVNNCMHKVDSGDNCDSKANACSWSRSTESSGCSGVWPQQVSDRGALAPELLSTPVAMLLPSTVPLPTIQSCPGPVSTNHQLHRFMHKGRLVSKILCDHMASMHSCIHHQLGREVDMAGNVGTAPSSRSPLGS